MLDKIVKYSLKLANHVGYDNVGTWEWIVSRSGQPYLLEVNTRIQVENDVSARISYVNGQQPNLIREQIRLALGEPMGYTQTGHHLQGRQHRTADRGRKPAARFCAVDRDHHPLRAAAIRLVHRLQPCPQ